METKKRKLNTTLGLALGVGTALVVALGWYKPAAAETPQRLLYEVSEAERQEVVGAHEFEIRIFQYFAPAGEFGIYRFDLSVLDQPSESIVFDLPSGEQIEILSYGITEDNYSTQNSATWTGGIKHRYEDRVFPVALGVSRWSITAEGVQRYPDLRREATLAAIESNEGVVSVESVERLEEKQVRSLRSEAIIHPAGRSRIWLRSLIGDYSHVMVYEEDPNKFFSIPVEGWGSVPPATEPKTAHDFEQIRRSEAYLAHVAMTRRQLGLAETQE